MTKLDWLYEQARRTLRSRSRRPKITTTEKVTGSTIYFLTPDYSAPSGGTRLMYRHVDLLNQLGLPAIALHQRAGFRYRWFENTTAVTDVHSTAVGPSDILVVPEIDVDVVADYPGLKHIILNQSGHLTWSRAAELVSSHYRSTRDLLGIVTVSEHCLDLLSYAFPDFRIELVRAGIDPAIFYAGHMPRERVISYLPRRGRFDMDTVIALVEARGALDGWKFSPLDGLSQKDFAERLRASKMMVALSPQEGFGLPAAEAMLSGNYVVGFHGFGGREFFKPEFSTAVEAGDVLGIARAVEEAIAHERTDDRWCESRGLKAEQFIRERYSLENELGDVEDAYRALISGHPLWKK